MSEFGDDDVEMFRRNDLDEITIEQLLVGHDVPGEEMLVSFVAGAEFVASSFEAEPTPELTALFAEEVSQDAAGLPTMAQSSAVVATQVAAPPERRRENMVESGIGKLASLGVAAKVGIAAGALVLSGSAAAATGMLPEPAQERIADAVERTGVDIPGGQSDDHRRDGDVRQDGEHRPDGAGIPAATGAEVTELPDGSLDTDEVPEDAEVPEDVEIPSLPAVSDFGSNVSGNATDGAPQEDGRQFGEDVSRDARETFQPQEPPTAEDNPGTPHRESAPSTQPQELPTAEDNPGSNFRP